MNNGLENDVNFYDDGSGDELDADLLAAIQHDIEVLRQMGAEIVGNVAYLDPDGDDDDLDDYDYDYDYYSQEYYDDLDDEDDEDDDWEDEAEIEARQESYFYYVPPEGDF